MSISSGTEYEHIQVDFIYVIPIYLETFEYDCCLYNKQKINRK